MQDMQIRYFNCSKLDLHTFRHRLNSDDFTGVSSSCRSDGHHPDTVLTVAAEVGDTVEKHIGGSFELAAHLRGKDFVSVLEAKASGVCMHTTFPH